MGSRADPTECDGVVALVRQDPETSCYRLGNELHKAQGIDQSARCRGGAGGLHNVLQNRESGFAEFEAYRMRHHHSRVRGFVYA